eukprot:TRINITY_DN7922_c0_g1_i1.p1 TRINITY_DN7922_c0_g1~~TRINITY_DN7922_c0_g1_i1.p1  ORF type:complete len:199 (+),score=45.52 TRINITY_DN7922_c0_g1_i1:42-638(+)
MSYNFSRAVDEQLVKDIQSADQLEDEAFAALIELIFSILTSSQTTAAMMAKVEQLANEHRLKPSTVNVIIKAWLTFFRSVQRASLTPKQLLDDLIQLGFKKGKATYIGKQYKAKLEDLSRTLVGRTLVVDNLVDLQWNFGVIAGSSEFKQSGSTFLQLKLTLNKGHGNEDIYLELTLPQFYEFLKAMEAAKSSLEYLS